MPNFIIVQDADGAVGAFSSVDTAIKILAPYSHIPFIFTRWEGEGEEAWVLPYEDTNAIAFAGTAREGVVDAQTTLKAVGLVCVDNVDYWKCKMDHVIEPALRRLEDIIATVTNAGACGEKEAKEAGKDTPDTQFLKMLAKGAEAAPFDASRINILEGVVCRELRTASPITDVESSQVSTQPEPSAGATEDGDSSEHTEQ